MTEAEWMACDDPAAMLAMLTDEGTRREQVLFTVACLRRAWHLVTDERCRALIESEELLLDGHLGEAEALRAFDAFEPAYVNGDLQNEEGDEIDHAVYDLVHVGFSYSASAANRIACAVADASSAEDDAPAWEAVFRSEKAAQARLLRDVVGSPIRASAVELAVRTPLIVALAQAAYGERHLPGGELDADRLGVLADALEDSGYAAAALLEHLRSAGPHVRGCFAVDMLLGNR